MHINVDFFKSDPLLLNRIATQLSSGGWVDPVPDLINILKLDYVIILTKLVNKREIIKQSSKLFYYKNEIKQTSSYLLWCLHGVSYLKRP